MSWILFSQIAALAVIVYFLVAATHAAITTNRREDAIKRKAAGV
jgi:hypothetical protein